MGWTSLRVLADLHAPWWRVASGLEAPKFRPVFSSSSATISRGLQHNGNLARPRDASGGAPTSYCLTTSLPSARPYQPGSPLPIRTAKLSGVEPGQYCGGGPRGKAGCCTFLLLPYLSFCFSLFFLFLSSRRVRCLFPLCARANARGARLPRPSAAERRASHPLFRSHV